MTSSVAVVPAVLMLFFSVVQLSLWFYARSVATTAAQHGLDAARVENGSTGEAQATVNQFLGQVGGLRESNVSAQRGAEEASVTVTGHAVDLLPFFDVTVDVTVEAPVERTLE